MFIPLLLYVHALETTCFSLRNQVSGYEQLKEKIKEFQYAQMNIINDKVAKLDVDLVEMALYLEEKFYPHLLTTISGQRPEACYVVAYNPDAEADYNSALQWLREVDFPLLAELSSHNYANVEDIMNLLCLDNQVVLGETSLLFALSVAHFRVEKIRENVVAQRSALVDIWVPLVEPLSAENLMGAAGTSDSMPATVATTTALSTTFVTTSSIPLITIDDYEIVSVDGQEDA
ncbi:hypothetical protein Tco_1396612 [Tanacetum coccineum]